MSVRWPALLAVISNGRVVTRAKVWSWDEIAEALRRIPWRGEIAVRLRWIVKPACAHVGAVIGEVFAPMIGIGVDEWREREPSCAGALPGHGAQEKHMTDDEIRAKLEAIARQYLSLDTLVERGRDRLDFHVHGVVSIQMALRAAYDAGRKAGAS